MSESNTISRTYGATTFVGEMSSSGGDNFRSESASPNSDYRIGSNMPNFLDIIKNGGDATTKLSGNIIRAKVISEGGYKMIEYINGSPTGWSMQGKAGAILPHHSDSLPSYVASMTDDAYAEALPRLISKINQLQTPFKMQEFLGELHETLAFLRNPLASVIKLSSNLRKLNSKTSSNLRKKDALRDTLLKRSHTGTTAGDVLASSGSVWLAYRFALLPLISDVSDIMSVIKNKTLKRKTMSVRSYAVSERSETIDMPDVGFTNYPLTIALKKTVTVKVEVILNAGVRFETVPPAGVDALWKSVVDWRQIPSTAWELIPSSWIFDYFINVGDIIQAGVSDVSHVSYKSKTVITTVTETYEYVVPQNVDYGNGYLTYVNVGSSTPTIYQTTKRYVERDTFNIGIPPVTFSLPGSKIRYANLAAVLSGLLKRRSI